MHLGIIPDGNRRYIRSLNKNITDLYDIWVDNIVIKKMLLDESDEPLPITHLSLYVLSSDNIRKRKDQSIEQVCKFIGFLFDNIKENLSKGKKIAIIPVITDLELLPEDISMKTMELIQLTKKYYNKEGVLQVYLAMSYDFEKDIINREQPPIDLIIRTSGEKRLSGFFPYYAANSEFFFLDKMFPELTEEDIRNILDEFKSRNRRFGS